MRAIAVAGVGISALALAGCMPKVSYEGHEVSRLGAAPLHVRAALDCPAQEGDLVRTAQAADGRSCAYERRGETVTLRLLALDGRTAAEALAPTQAELRTLVPFKAAAIAALAKDEIGDRADVDLPFFHVHTAGDRAEVKVFGIKVHSEGDNAEVHMGGARKHTVVHAGPQGAEIVTEDLGKTNAELVYVLAADKPAPSGYRAVGYVAKGPAQGPLVVGEFRAADSEREGPEPREETGDLGRLIDRNLGS